MSQLALLQQLVRLLSPAGTGAQSQQLEQALEELARWRLGCGDLAACARWRRLALPPHRPAALRRELAQLLVSLELHDLALELQNPAQPDRPDPKPGWPQLQRALLRGHYSSASRQQSALLAASADAPPTQQPPQLLAGLVWAWLQAGRSRSALDLLNCGEGRSLEPGAIDAAPVATAIGWVLRASQPERSACWWQRSLAINPNQPALLAALQQIDGGTIQNSVARSKPGTVELHEMVD
jgi:hypothetical protein